MVGKKKGGGSFKLDDFIPDYCKQKRTPVNQAAMESALRAQLNAMAKKRNG